MIRPNKNKYETTILADFDTSVILPFYKKFDAFAKILPLNAIYFQRNGIEVIIVLDEPSQEQELLELINKYPLINWVVIINRQEHLWRNPAKVINVGIRAATKKYIMVCSPESFFETDAILKLRTMTETYRNVFAIGKVYFSTYGNNSIRSKTSLPYGSIMTEKSSLIEVGCYKEDYDSWGGEDDNIRAKLEFGGYKKMYADDAILIHFEESATEILKRDSKPRYIPDTTYRSSLTVKPTDLIQEEWGRDFSEKIFDYKNKMNGYKNCIEYLARYADFSVTSKLLFDEEKTVIALLHTYNEELNILGIIQHLEEIADGIILLDDGSTDRTYELAHSNKLICKAKKTRQSAADLNELDNKNILLDIASFVTCECMFFIDADERLYLFGKKLHQILETCQKAGAAYLVHLWDTETAYRADVPEVSPINLPGVLHRWRFFRNIGHCQILSDINFHFKHTPFQVTPTVILPILIFHYGMLTYEIRNKKHGKYLCVDKKENHDRYDYFLDETVQTSKVSDLVYNLPNYF